MKACCSELRAAVKKARTEEPRLTPFGTMAPKETASEFGQLTSARHRPLVCHCDARAAFTLPRAGSGRWRLLGHRAMPRLIVISNRLPFSIRSGAEAGVYEFVPSSGGLVSALSSYIDRRTAEDPQFECVWVGWPGGTVALADQAAVRSQMAQEQRAQPVFLTEPEMDSFYHGFCNSTLWPLFHYFPSYTAYSEEQWETYQSVNRIFCETALDIIRPGDVVWVHDYQLLLAL